jgi:hypothetical protein
VLGVPVLRQQPPVPRRVPSRAFVRFTPVKTTNAPPPVPVLRQLPVTPRRVPSRAVIRFVPARTVNAIPVPVAGPQQYRTAPRRKLSRAYIRFTPVTTTNAPIHRTLFVSLASKAGTDDYGNAFLSGVVSYLTIASGPAAGSYALQAGQVNVLGTPAPGFFIHNMGAPEAIPPSIVAIAGPGGCEIVLGSGASTSGSTEAAVVVQDSTLSGLAGGLVNIIASQLQVNGTPVTVP